MQLQVILAQKDEYQPTIRRERENNSELNVVVDIFT